MQDPALREGDAESAGLLGPDDVADDVPEAGPDGAHQDAQELLPEEGQGPDDGDGDEREDEGILGQALPGLGRAPAT